MRMNFQGSIKETSEQIKIQLKDKHVQIEAISSLLTDVIGVSFVANVILGRLRSKQLLKLHQTF